MPDLSKYLLYLPGLIVFLVGSGQVRRWLYLRRGGATFGDVVSCQHVVKKDKKDREVYNYYNVVVSFINKDNQHRERQAVKSPTEFAVGQQVRVIKDSAGGQYQLVEEETQFVINPWEMMVGGALLILLAMYSNQGKEVPAMVCLALVLAGAGAALIADYVLLKKRGLVPVTGEIVEVYTRQISRGTKIVKGDKFTYYPVVRYVIDGKENLRKCNVNSGNENSFKVGETMELYYDPKYQTVFERKASTGYLVAGIVLLAIGLAAGMSILSVI